MGPGEPIHYVPNLSDLWQRQWTALSEAVYWGTRTRAMIRALPFMPPRHAEQHLERIWLHARTAFSYAALALDGRRGSDHEPPPLLEKFTSS